MFLGLDDDVLRTIAATVKNIQFYGPISIVMLSRVCRRFYYLVRDMTLNTKHQWVEGFSASFTWKVDRFCERVGDVYSPVFTSPHGHHWRLLLFFNGNGVTDCGPSLYLDISNADFLHVGWQRPTVFKLKFTHNMSQDADIVTPLTEITFSRLNRDWGYRVIAANFNHLSFCDNFVDKHGCLTVVCEVHTRPIVPSSVHSKVFSKLLEVQDKEQIVSNVLKRAETFTCAFCKSQLVKKFGQYVCAESNKDCLNAFYSLSKVLQPDVKKGTMLNAIDECCMYPTVAGTRQSFT